MGPKKKKQPKNAFYFFMMEWKEEKEEQGMRFPGGLKEVSVLCDDDWKSLPPNLMERYKKMENEAKLKDKTDLTNKFTSTGVTYQQMEKERQAAEAFNARMNIELQQIIEQPLNVLRKHCFYLIHCNVYIFWGERRKWIANEVAITEFNLLDGVRKVYHVFPPVPTPDGKLPMGYKLESKQRRESTHCIPDPEDFEEDVPNWEQIVHDVKNFLMPNGGKDFPPLFTMEDDFNTNNNMTAVKDFLYFLKNDDTSMNFRVYPLPLLFFHLRNTCCSYAEMQEDKFVSVGLALQQLERDYYNYHEELACDFHRSSKTELFTNCSSSVVKRWVYLICEFCCQYAHVQLLPGKHCVTTAQINESPLMQKVTHAPREDPEGWCTVSKPAAPRGSGSATSAAPPAYRPVPTQTRPIPQPSPAADLAPTQKPVVTASASPLVWGRGMINKAAETPRMPMQADERKPGLSTQSSRPVVGRGIPVPSMAGLTIIDRSKVPDPNLTRTYKTGQSPNVVSEIYPDDSPSAPSLRMPKTHGLGESLAMAISKKDSTAPIFGADDFPAMGAASRKLDRPIGSAWGRGLSFRSDSS